MHVLSNEESITPLINDISERRIVMLGEASHGTHEFYTWRTAITKKLIETKGFQFIAVEGDWPDCYLINRYVKGYADAGTDIRKLLLNFDRWPTWMWANWEVAALAEWLREFNTTRPPAEKIGFYGLDVYSLWDSMKAMISYLEKEDPQAARSAKKALTCFDPFNENEQEYARFTLRGHHCHDEVISLLKEIRMKAQYLDGDREAGFNTEQNAFIVVNAEKYYRSMTSFNEESWNIRDHHMMETFNRLLDFHGALSKGIIWEHNTHIGDARATDMSSHGMINIGQLAREQYGVNDVYLTGFGTFKGTVIAGREWGAQMEEMQVPEARKGSIEYKLHSQYQNNVCMFFNEEDDEQYDSRIPHRAIGVVYAPEREKMSNYVPTTLSARYDAFIFLDQTRALHPLHLKPHDVKIPETYPFGM